MATYNKGAYKRRDTSKRFKIACSNALRRQKENVVLSANAPSPNLRFGLARGDDAICAASKASACAILKLTKVLACLLREEGDTLNPARHPKDDARQRGNYRNVPL